MKFETLTIHNLTSIKDATIEFQSAPIADSDVFLITGDTGAGKTTILDAICLALYNDVPRMDRKKIKGEATLAGTNERIMNYDPRQLMRPNTAEAFAALTFIGNNGQHYEAKWVVRRARNKVTGNLQGKEWTLINLDTNTTYSKDNDIKAELLRVTDLTFTQFCRTSMLSQGEFTRFLISDDDEKAEILEKITGVDKYSKIGKKIYETYKEKEEKLDLINKKIELILCLDNDAIEEKKQRMATLASEIEKEEKNIGECQTKSQWLTEVKNKKEELKSAKQRQSTAQGKADSDAFKANKKMVNDWNRTIDIRATFNDCNAARQESQMHEKDIQKLRNDYLKHKGEHLWIEDLLKQKKQEQELLSQALKDVQDWVPMFEKEQVLVKDFTSISEQTALIGKEKEKMVGLEAWASQLEGQKKQATEKETSAKEDFEKAEKALASTTEQVNACGLPALRERRDALMADMQKIGEAIAALEALYQEQERRKTNAQKLDDINNTIIKNTRLLQEKELTVNAAKSAKEALEGAFNSQKSTIDDWAKSMRATLKIGDICPICQHKIESELPHEETLEKLVQGLEQQYLEAKEKFDKEDQEQRELLAKIEAYKTLLQKEKETFDNNKGVEKAEKVAQEKVKLCGIDALLPNAKQSLEEQKSQKELDKNELETTIAEGEKLEAKKDQCQKEVDSKRDAWDQAKKVTQKLDDQVKETGNQKEMAQSNIAHYEGLVKQAKAEIQGILIPADWNTNWETEPQEAAKALSARTKDYNQKAETLSRIKNETEKLQNDMKNISQTFSKIDSIEPDWNKAPFIKGSENLSLINDVQDLYSKLNSQKDALETSESKVQNNEKILSEYYAQNPDITPALLAELNRKNGEEIKAIQEGIKEVENEVLAIQSALKTLNEQWDALQTQKPTTLQEEETLESLAIQKEEQEKAKKEAIEEKAKIDEELKQDTRNKENKKGLLEDKDIAQKERDNWKYMNDLYGDSEGKKLRRIAQSYVLADLISAANNYMQRLTDRYTLSVTPGSFIINVIDAYDGYIARSSSTISGGEKFLVSLALALALSDVGINWSTDILFIDEGFGSLSGEPLQRAIDTLHSLNKITGRHVGIISHIKEVAEKIPVQIQVIRPGFNACSTVNTVVVS